MAGEEPELGRLEAAATGGRLQTSEKSSKMLQLEQLERVKVEQSNKFKLCLSS